MSVFVRRFGVIIVIAIVVIGVIVFRDRLTGNASDLVVGDCFDAPSTIGTVQDVQHHPCTEAHTGEVFAVVKNPAGGSDPYPSDDAMRTYAGDACAAPFLTYVGLAMDQSSYDIRYFSPTSEGWGKGDRSVTCYVNTDPPVTTTIKGSKK